LVRRTACRSQPTDTDNGARGVGHERCHQRTRYTQAAWWNRIPVGAWTMMAPMAISCNLLVGYSERRKSESLLFIVPFVISV
jgi:hypothetical protein